jgi:NADH-quinone oxidoreductase subunit H
VAKIGVFMLFFVWVRWSFPRFRFDQLMRLGWKILLPLAIVNLVVVAALTVAGVL